MKKIYTILVFLFSITNLFSQLNGPKTIDPSGSGENNYTSFSSAITALNTNGTTTGVTFLIAGGTYTETNPLTIDIAVNKPTASATVTFKPAEGATVTLNIGGQTSTAKFALRIGTSTSSTDYIILDGSNSNGTTRDLTIKSSGGTSNSVEPIDIYGSYCIVKNCIIDMFNSGYSGSGYGVTLRETGSTSKNCIIQNNKITGNNAISIGRGTSGGDLTGHLIKGNEIHFVNRGIYAYRSSNIVIEDNVIIGDAWNNYPTQPCYGIYTASPSGNIDILIIRNNIIRNLGNNIGTVAAVTVRGIAPSGPGTYKIYNNKIYNLSNATTGTGTPNIYGIELSSGASSTNYDIFNNFIFGFLDNDNDVIATVYTGGIRYNTSGNANIYFNSILINDTEREHTCSGIHLNGGSSSSIINLKNNLIYNKNSSIYQKSYGIYKGTLTGILNSDFNNYYVSGIDNAFFGFDGSDRLTLSNWQTATSKDQNSISKNVEFVSATDLHLTGLSIGDNDLNGTIIAGYNTDIDGSKRDPLFPYMGADEDTTIFLHSLSPRTVPMRDTINNNIAFGTKGLLGTDNNGSTKFYTHWDNTCLYLGWDGGNTNYSSDMFYAAIDTDPDGSNGCINPIEGVSFKDGGPKPDFFVVYENNSSFYGAPASNGNAYELYNGSTGNWSWVSRTDGNNNTSSKVIFANPGEVRLRIPWTQLNFTPGTTAKIGIVMWNNNGSGNYMWGRVPSSNPNNGSTPIILDYQFIYSSTGAGVNPSIDMISTPLPVELSSFVSSVKGSTVQLSWKTATEKDNYGFDVERSVNNSWEKVGFVQGNGNSNSAKDYSFVDNNLKEGKYSYRLKQIDNNGKYTYSNVIEVEVSIPNEYGLSQNYPNPFNPSTTISYNLPVQSKVQLNIYSISGELVASLVNEEQPAGSYNINFDASKLATGTYIYRLIANDFMMTKKMLLIK